MCIRDRCARVAASFLLFLVWTEKGIPVTPLLAAAGLFVGELVSMLFSGILICLDFNRHHYHLLHMTSPVQNLKTILQLSVPLTCNRILVNVLHSIESVLIPGHLRLYGLDQVSSLSIYGVLTGMALPLILFPCAVTLSLIHI